MDGTVRVAEVRETPHERRDGVSFARLLWIGPLTVVVALAVNLAIRAIAVALNPSLAEMGQLGRPMIILTVEGVILAVRLPWDRVLLLMLLHAATAVVCIVMLTTLTREPAASERRS